MSDKISSKNKFRASELFLLKDELDIEKRFDKTPQSFLKWLVREGSWGRIVYLLCFTFSIWNIVFFNASEYQKISSFNTEFNSWATLFHALIILFIFVFFEFRKNTNSTIELPKNDIIDIEYDEKSFEKSVARARLAVKQFLRFLPAALIMWFFLYIFLSTYYFLDAPDGLWFLGSVFNALNNSTSLALFSMYYELSERTAGEGDPKNLWMIFFLLLVLILFAEFVSSAINLDNPIVLQSINLSFSIFSGILGGIATALVTMRLASRILGIPSAIIFILTLYAIIQPLFPMVAGPKTLIETIIGIIAVNIAVYGKATFVILLLWLLTTRRLDYYMIRALQMIEEEHISREVFLGNFVSKKTEI